MFWQTSRRRIALDHPLVMAILNVTPDSFSDGGAIESVDDALRAVEHFIDEGADIIDIGGESTRPGSTRVDVETELKRTLPVVTSIAKRFDIPISIDTSKSVVATALIDSGAEIINDISGLRWDSNVADVSARTGAALVLMHSRGDFETMHSQPADDDNINVVDGLRSSLETARSRGVRDEQIALDIGIGFGKTPEQNLELLAKIDKIVTEFEMFPILVGASRKSFIGKLTGEQNPVNRLAGSLAAAAIAVANGVRIVRVHDVKETREAITVAEAIRVER